MLCKTNLLEGDWKIKFHKPAAKRNAEVIKAALVVPMTTHELAEIVHLTPKAVKRYLVALRAKDEIYRCGHKMMIRDKGKPLPIPQYMAGNAPDVVYKAADKAANAKLYIQRRRMDPERHDRYLAKERARKMKPKAQDELQYFFGRIAA